MICHQKVSTDRRGVAAVEFALVLPLLITMYFGAYTLCDAVSAYRKVSTTARAMSDFATQYQTVTDSDLDDALNLSTQVMAPFSAASTQLIISQIDISATGVATVAWSRAKNTTKRATNSVVILPAGMTQLNSSLIMSEVSFSYQSNVMPEVLGTIPLSDRMFMSPRTVRSITKV